MRGSRFRPWAALGVAVVLAGCATQAVGHAPGAPGFLIGLVHGIIAPIAFVISLIDSEVAIYAVPNSGGW